MKKGNQTAVRRNKKAFTLVELFIVSAIMLVLVAFSMPLCRKTFTDLELREAASNIARFISYAQQRAVVDETTYKIHFDFGNKTYQFLELSTPASRASGEGGAAGETYGAVSGRFGRIFQIPKGIEIEGEAEDIIFSPGGECTKWELRLTNKNEKMRIITTTGTLGNVVIKDDYTD